MKDELVGLSEFHAITLASVNRDEQETVTFLNLINKKSATRVGQTNRGRPTGIRHGLELLEDRLVLSLTPLSISPNNRYLVDGNDKPFLIQGDAGWELIISTTQAEADQYLTARANQGFNMILVNLIDHLFGPNAPANMAGDYPFYDSTTGQHRAFIDPPNEAYFAYADWVINAAASRGMYVLLDPSYLGFGGGNEGFYSDMQAAGTTRMLEWGRYVGNRYKDYGNIVWMQGGDFNPPADGLELVNQVALGIQEYSSNLQTAHTQRLSSAEDIWGNYSWLALNNTYANELTYDRSLVDYNRAPVSATFLVEDIYENEHGITEQQGRAEKYWNILSGSSGALMGNDPIWGFDLNLDFGTLGSWQNWLNSQMATDMTRLGQLFDARDWYNLVPDQGHATVTGGFGTFGNANYVTAAKTPDGHLAMAYMPSSRTLTVDMSKLSGSVVARWFDPTNGAYTDIAGSPFANSGNRNFTTPGNNSAGDGDWVLVLEVGVTVSLSLSGSPMSEVGGSTTVTATLPAVSTQDVTVDLAFSGTATNVSDYTRSGTQIVIAAGNTTGTVTLTAVQDTLDENDETVVVDISGVTNGTESGTQQVTATISDDDPLPTVTVGVSPASFAEAAGTSTITATLSAASGLDVTVDLAFSGTVTNVADYTRSATQIVITAGNTTGTVTLTAVQDTLDENDETAVVDISGVTNGTESGTQQVTATITDDDPLPSVALGVSPALFTEASETSTITATLSEVSGLDVTVDLAFSGTATNLTDYTRSATQIVIAAGNTTGTVTLTTVPDALDETDETIIVDVIGVTNGAESGVQSVTATIDGDDDTQDFGDAPAPYPTRLADDGARHLAAGPTLGVNRDAESDGTNSTGALGDDTNPGAAPDDEDGITLPPAIVTRLSATATVTASAPAKLDAWFDFNRDGDWTDAGEQIAASLSLAAGDNSVSFAVPANAVAGTTFARFRLSTSGGLAPTGQATDGEVEDYAVDIVAPAESSAALVNDPLHPTQNVLIVLGSSSDDRVTIKSISRGPQVNVILNKRSLASFDGRQIGRILVFGLAGNDSITVNSNVLIDVQLRGDDGNDKLKAGGGNAVVLGGAGNDVLVAQGSRSLLVGGEGADKLTGRDSILIAGTTAYDSQDHALTSILTAWTAPTSYNERVVNLRTGNAVPSLNATAVFDDLLANQLRGGRGFDWFFRGDLDRIRGNMGSEFIETV
jgi:hypothetical protein